MCNISRTYYQSHSQIVDIDNMRRWHHQSNTWLSIAHNYWELLERKRALLALMSPYWVSPSTPWLFHNLVERFSNHRSLSLFTICSKRFQIVKSSAVVVRYAKPCIRLVVPPPLGAALAHTEQKPTWNHEKNMKTHLEPLQTMKTHLEPW